MTKIMLSADSTCDLNDELLARYDVRYSPLHINLRDAEYLDNVTITVDKVFEAYFEDKSLPKTAAVSIGEYVEHFRALLAEGEAIIHVGLGGALSCSVANAAKAVEMLHAEFAAAGTTDAAGTNPADSIFVIDSQNLSTGSGQLVIRAGRMIEEGVPAAEIAEQLRAIRTCVHASFLLDNLEFMAAGGRCPAILAHVGKIVQIRPHILVNNTDGSMKIGGIYRGKLLKALLNYVDDTLAAYDDIIPDDIFVTDSGVDDEVWQAVAERVRKRVPFERIHHTHACCTIGSHCGPNCLGILFVTRS